ncbi:uncharacterized protein LOC141855051 [Brevipalpus obovatus]|uniref:uncharacterized protein LOC141855051 n=1 Tax=Brevipalpus obovatus TaxID=246614 RepID=UPI003D9EBA7A
MANVLRPLNVLTARKRKKRPSLPLRSPSSMNSRLNKSYDDDFELGFVIDDSSPQKKAKRSPDDASQWFLGPSRTFQNRRSSSSFSLQNQRSLVNKLKKALANQRSNRESWLHHTTSGLKNKIKESTLVCTSINIKLCKLVSRYGLTVCDGIVEKAEEGKDSFTLGEIVKIVFPNPLASTMELSSGTLMKIVSPWKIMDSSGVKLISNPFWVSVESRLEERDTIYVEKEVHKWSCECRDSLGQIDSYRCGKNDATQCSDNEGYSQPLSQPSSQPFSQI